MSDGSALAVPVSIARELDPKRAVLLEALAADDGRLQQIARGNRELGLEVPQGGFVGVSSMKLSNMLQNDSDEARRHIAFHGLRCIQPHVLEHGSLELVAKRNRSEAASAWQRGTPRRPRRP